MPDAPPPPPPPPHSDVEALRTELERATSACLETLEAFRRGDIDESELQARALEAGVVHTPKALWLLDLATGRWVRYDGLTLTGLDELVEEG